MKLFSNIKKGYQNIFTKIITIYIIGTIIIFSIIIAANIETNRLIKIKTEYSDYNSLSFYAETMENDVNNIINIQYMLLSDEDVWDYINLHHKSSQFTEYKMTNKVKTLLTRYTTMNPMISGVCQLSCRI